MFRYLDVSDCPLEKAFTLGLGGRGAWVAGREPGHSFQAHPAMLWCQSSHRGGRQGNSGLAGSHHKARIRIRIGLWGVEEITVVNARLRTVRPAVNASSERISPLYCLLLTGPTRERKTTKQAKQLGKE